MVFTDNGVLEVVKHMKGSTAVYPTHLGVGTSAVAADVSDTTLAGETGNRYGFTVTSNVNSILYTGIVPTTDNNGSTIQEAGGFSATTSGVMFSRFTHSPIVKTSSVEIQYDITMRVLNVNW